MSQRVLARSAEDTELMSLKSSRPGVLYFEVLLQSSLVDTQANLDTDFCSLIQLFFLIQKAYVNPVGVALSCRTLLAILIQLWPNLVWISQLVAVELLDTEAPRNPLCNRR